MNVVPFVHEGLGNSSYLVGLEDNKAVLIDPDRTVNRYLQAAEERGWRITAVFETHLHADFISGALEAANRTSARTFVPEGGNVRFDHQPVRSGETIRLEGAEILPVPSPGHTPEHTSYVLNAERRPPALFSGGSLIVGGAARSDLIAPEQTEALTRAQYRTLTNAFSSLPDETLLYPTHGSGSFCSTGSGGDRTSTLGQERATNPALDFDDEEEFARWFPTTFPETPAYYSRMRPINQQGPRLLEEIAQPPRMTAEEFDRARQGGLVVDVRSVEDYAAAHVSGSLSVPFRDAYAVWLGWLAPPDTPLLFILDGVPQARVVEESLLVGYERFAGLLDGGIDAWLACAKPLATSDLVGRAEARDLVSHGALPIDVREPDEFAAGHLPDAVHLPLGSLEENLVRLPNDRPLLVYCGGGHRSSTAVSILERSGFQSVHNLAGGYEAWAKDR